MKIRLTEHQTKEIWRHADAVCFDVDSTVVTGEGLDEFAAFCGRGAEVAEWTIKAMSGGVSFRTALEERLKIISPTLKQVLFYVPKLDIKLENFIKKSSLHLTAHIRDVISTLMERGTEVYLVSGGFRSIIEPIAEDLKIPKENIFANTILFDDKGMYNGFDLNEPTSDSGGKAKVIELLKQKHNYHRHVMIGDGATDMEACPPADAFIGFGGNVVRQKVKENASWFVMDFKILLNELQSIS
ncbi:hypothetical protein QZH41_013277 [Actinostola sp. cb2023]|nr:hypothetical protein QZH41_013277 [Actinostola sp. cb2023]